MRLANHAVTETHSHASEALAMRAGDAVFDQQPEHSAKGEHPQRAERGNGDGMSSAERTRESCQRSIAGSRQLLRSSSSGTQPPATTAKPRRIFSLAPQAVAAKLSSA
ncbi:hypothetical protein H8B02_11950 [Bradyrhizobium sp. Pear77]|uniref:hypothetical protein n=1 Tax=Bradyrhizobium altum TaxID=1571202 RepID=UPI001E32F8BC|nr:hypothetical protein [Bradyrhizobium altum]MCC8954141.1 hypothetical protein [Bradyrhizobium altum]